MILKPMILVLAVGLGGCASAPKTSKVVPNNPKAKAAIERAIRKEAGKPTGELTQADLEKVKRFSLAGGFYGSSRYNITDLTPLAGLTKLEKLSLPQNQITDLTPLAGMTELKTLYLVQNQITDLTPLAGLTKLEMLYLHTNPITDLTPLAGLTKLEGLGLQWNQVTDLTPLAGLTGLKRLFLRNNLKLTKAEIDKHQKALPKCSIYHNARK